MRNPSEPVMVPPHRNARGGEEGFASSGSCISARQGVACSQSQSFTTPASLCKAKVLFSPPLSISSCDLEAWAARIWISYSEPYHIQSGDISSTVMVGSSGSATYFCSNFGGRCWARFSCCCFQFQSWYVWYTSGHESRLTRP